MAIEESRDLEVRNSSGEGGGCDVAVKVVKHRVEDFLGWEESRAPHPRASACGLSPEWP
jgi:hypothetical protein